MIKILSRFGSNTCMIFVILYFFNSYPAKSEDFSFSQIPGSHGHRKIQSEIRGFNLSQSPRFRLYKPHHFNPETEKPMKFPFLKKFFLTPKTKDSRFLTPELFVRKDIDYKILNLHVSRDIDFKILDLPVGGNNKRRFFKFPK